MNKRKEKDQLTSYIESGGKSSTYEELRDSTLAERAAIQDFITLPQRCLIGGCVITGLTLLGISIYNKTAISSTLCILSAVAVTLNLSFQMYRQQKILTNELFKESDLKRAVIQSSLLKRFKNRDKG